MTPTIEQYLEAKKITDAWEAEEGKRHIEKVLAYRKDLEDYFANNKVEGRTIKKFRLQDDAGTRTYSIIPLEPWIEEDYEGGNNADIEALAEKHGIKSYFHYTMYHK